MFERPNTIVHSDEVLSKRYQSHSLSSLVVILIFLAICPVNSAYELIFLNCTVADQTVNPL